MIWLKWCGYSLLFVFVLFLSIGTPWGTQLLLSIANSQVDGLYIEHRSGGIWGALDLEKVSWQDANTDLKLTNVQTDIDWSCSFSLRVCVKSLSVGGVLVHVRPAIDPSPAEPLTQKITLPLPVSVKQLKINNVQVNVDKVMELRWKSLDSQLNMYQSLNIKHLALQQPSVTLPAPETPKTEEPFDFAQIANWQYQPMQLPPLLIPLDATIDKLTISGVTVKQQQQLLQQIERIELVAKLVDSAVTINKLTVDLPQANITAKGYVEPGYQLQLDALWKSKSAATKPVEVKLALSGAPSKFNINASSTGSYVGDLRGWVDITSAQLPASLQASWQALSIPSANNLTINAGKLAIDGDLQAYQLKVDTSLTATDMPVVDIALKASGNHQSARLSDSRIKVLGGSIDINGEINIDNALNFQTGVVASNIQPQQFWPDYQADLNAKVQVSGKAQRDHVMVQLTDLSAKGNWLGFDLKALGTAKYDSTYGLNVPEIKIVNGDNSVTIAGTLDNQQAIDFNITVDGQALSQLYPKLEGKLSLQALATGTITNPALEYKLSSGEWEYAGASLRKLESSGKLLWKDDKPINIKLVATELVSSDAEVEVITVTLTGDASLHTLNTQLRSNVMNIESSIQGELEQTSWQGVWREGQFASQWGNYQLDSEPEISIDWGRQSYKLGAHCWQDANGSLCIRQAKMQDNQVKFDVTGDQLELLQIVGAFVPQVQSISSETRLFFSAQGDWQLDGSPKAHIEGRLSPADIKLAGVAKPIEMQSMKFNADIDDHKVVAHVDVQTKYSGKILLDGTVDDYMQTGTLDIGLQINNFLLRPYLQFVPQLSELTGEINGNVKVTGNIKRPLLSGTLAVSDVNLAGEILPGRVDNWHQDIEFAGESAKFNGEFGFGNGRGKSQGDLDWSGVLIGSMSLQGDQFELEYRDTVRAKFSPNIKVALRSDAIEVNGNVDVIYARIKVKELPPDAQAPSDDVIIVNQPKEQVTPARPINLRVKINIDPSNSNNVKLEAFGLKTDLQGGLELKQHVGKLSGLGELRLVNGKYKAYGQDLIIQKGNIQFSGPLDSPNIDVVAIRDPAKTQDGVVAGIRVYGDAEQPSVDIYSEPAMSQSRALSYLVQGKDLGSGGEGQSVDEQMLASVLLSAGLKNSENKVDQLGRSLGIEDLALGAEDGSKVALSGYIAPGVQLKYGVSVFDSSSEVTLRYQLRPQLYLEAISGAENSLEILYQFTLGKRPTATSGKNTETKDE